MRLPRSNIFLHHLIMIAKLQMFMFVKTILVFSLMSSKHPAAIRANMLAQSEGVISESDQDFSALTGALDQLGIIAANRWEILLAP